MLRIGIVAGEESGDLLGANLIEAVKEKISDVEIVGIGGDQLTKAGCKTLYPMEKLSVMGIVEVFSRYFELLSIRKGLKKYFLGGHCCRKRASCSSMWPLNSPNIGKPFSASSIAGTRTSAKDNVP